MIRRTALVLLRIVRSSVNGGPILSNCDTDQQAIRSSERGLGISRRLDFDRNVSASARS